MNDLVDTIDYYIRECEAEMVDLSWQIREETNYEDNQIDSLSFYYDECESRLESLKKIRTLVTNEKLAQ